MNRMHRAAIVLVAVAALTAQAELHAAEPGTDFRARAIGVYLGAMEVDDQSVRIQNSDVLDDAELDFSTLPGGGIFVDMPFAEGAVEFGLESGAGFAWRTDDTSVSGRSINGDTTIRVDVDNSFLLADLGMGLYTRVRLGQAASLYAGGGPALVYGRHSVEDEEVSPAPEGTVVVLGEDEGSDLSGGYYARAGIDFELQGGYRLGLGAKWLGAELDFDDTIGNADIEGVFFFLNIGQSLP